MFPEFRLAVFKWRFKRKEQQNEEEREKEKERSIAVQIQMLFASLQSSARGAIHTRRLTKAFGWNERQVFQIHYYEAIQWIVFFFLSCVMCMWMQVNPICVDFRLKQKSGVEWCNLPPPPCLKTLLSCAS